MKAATTTTCTLLIFSDRPPIPTIAIRTADCGSVISHPDFRQHSVAYFFEPLLANHDPSIVETFCYADVSTPDAVTARLQKHASQWRSVVGQSDAQIAEQIQLDQIDILVDLAGHTGGGRLTLFGRKPAPVQATYLGYPDSTGVSTVDYRITDSIADPPDASPLGTTENLIRLACPFLTFLPPADSPDLSPLPALQSEYITFGSFNALPKLTTGTIDLWSAVMNAVPQSRMMIKARGLQHAEIANRLAAQFATHGIERDRLTFLGHEKTTGSHLARYHQIDIALDAFPYHGTHHHLRSVVDGRAGHHPHRPDSFRASGSQPAYRNQSHRMDCQNQIRIHKNSSGIGGQPNQAHRNTRRPSPSIPIQPVN